MVILVIGNSMSMVKKILFLTLSNIGDVILTLPVLDSLRHNYPEAKITVVCGTRPAQLFASNPDIKELIIFEKRSKLREKVRLLAKLKAENFDVVVDFRNSFFGLVLSLGKKSSFFSRAPAVLRHMKDRHMQKIRYLNLREPPPNKSLYASLEDKKYVDGILSQNNILAGNLLIIVSAGARSHIKRWPKEKFIQVIRALGKEFNAKFLLVGDKDDSAIAGSIASGCGNIATNLCGLTSLTQLAYLLTKTKLAITNDSAILHLASYLNVKVIAIFGPTNQIKYGPWSQTSIVAKKDIFCRPCEKAQCKFGTLKCMQLVRAEDVLKEARSILAGNHIAAEHREKKEFKRILVVRTDRIGDVLLSTPVLKALRDNFPHAYIAMMVSPYAKDIVEGNPFLDEVIIYDKDAKHKSWFKSMKFSRVLKKKQFDVALILHPINRSHLITFFAGIKKRIGYDRKLGFLLTDRIEHTKQLGQKHELEYNLDLVRYLGVEPFDKEIFIPIKNESERWAKEIFAKEGIREDEKLLVIHPGASCVSKIWPAERFACIADKLVEKYGFKVLIVAGPKDINIAQNVIRSMHVPVIDLAGKTSISQLASILKRSSLLISNDSGPVHVASAVGAPVISIFGRSQKGLSPKRWGPSGKFGRVLHKDVGCVECLAHNCAKEFLCLNSISVDEVVQAAEELLKASSN